jgi:hypothetical protein
MSTPHIRGVAGLLDQILTTVECTPPDSGRTGSSIARQYPRIGSTDCPNVPRVVARRGRPSGKAVAVASKEKVTVRVATDLIAAYREWSWEARSQLSHLVEQALTDYESRHRHSTAGPFRQDANIVRKRVGG